MTGTPTRPAVLDRAAARTRLGIEPESRCLLIFGGSQAVRRLNGGKGVDYVVVSARAAVKIAEIAPEFAAWRSGIGRDRRS